MNLKRYKKEKNIVAVKKNQQITKKKKKKTKIKELVKNMPNHNKSRNINNRQKIQAKEGKSYTG